MIYFTVGPTQLYPTVGDHILDSLKQDTPSISHRGAAFAGWYKTCVKNLGKLLGIPADSHIYFLSSGTEGMERVIQNTVSNSSLHLIQGAFGTRWYEIASELKKNPHKIVADHHKAFTSIDIKSGKFKGVDLVCITHNDTSTGIRIGEQLISEIKSLYPKAIIAIDAVSSVPTEPIPWDMVDCAFFGVQKGFGLPAGLGVLVISDRALKRSYELKEGGVNIGTYHSFPTLESYAKKWQTPETPSTWLVYLLSRVTTDMCKMGIGSIRKTTESYAQRIYGLVDNSTIFSCLIDGPDRSRSTLCLNVKGGSKRFIEYAQSMGVVVGSGYGSEAEKQIRIALFPAHTTTQVNVLVSVMKKYEKECST